MPDYQGFILVVWVVAWLFVVAMYFGHLGWLVIDCSLSKRTNRPLQRFEASKLLELLLASFKLDISDAEGVGSAGEGVISSIHIYNIALRTTNVKPFFHK